MATRKVTTATLIRGQVYTFRHPDYSPQNPKEPLRFKRGEPKIIEDAKIVTLLENLHEEIPDSDGELTEKPVFRINRNVDAPDEEGSTVRRVSADRAVRSVANGKKPLRLRK